MMKANHVIRHSWYHLQRKWEPTYGPAKKLRATWPQWPHNPRTTATALALSLCCPILLMNNPAAHLASQNASNCIGFDVTFTENMRAQFLSPDHPWFHFCTPRLPWCLPPPCLMPLTSSYVLLKYSLSVCRDSWCRHDTTLIICHSRHMWRRVRLLQCS